MAAANKSVHILRLLVFVLTLCVVCAVAFANAYDDYDYDYDFGRQFEREYARQQQRQMQQQQLSKIRPNKPQSNISGGSGNNNAGRPNKKKPIAQKQQQAKPKPQAQAQLENGEGGSGVDTGSKFITKNIPNVGRVRGRITKSRWNGQNIMQFIDVPYGRTTGGNGRFKPPQPAEPWKELLPTNKPHPGCPSIQNLELFNTLETQGYDVEDCLRLTIDSKSLTGEAPVMVYIHGDFLYDGNSQEAAPGYLLEQEVVLVSVRYRLGPFGFLSTMTDEIPGNAAVHDIILALQWIQNHISEFGGDASRVTLFGQVAGSSLINVLTMSPAVPDGLFHRVIYQSGSALSPAFITDNPVAASRDIGRFAGCKNVNRIDQLNKCIKKLNVTTLLEAFNYHGDAKSSLGIGFYGGVQIVIGGPSGILPDHPGKLLANDKFKPYPTMGGTVKNGGTFILKDIYIDNFNETIIDDKMNAHAYIDHIIQQTNGADPTGAWKKYALAEIFSADDIKNGSFYCLIPGLIDMCSTIPFKNPVLLALQANAKKLPQSTYLYSFDYAGEMNRYSTQEDDTGEMPFDLGVSLTDDNLYLFPWPQFSTINSNTDIKIAKRLVALWTSFAASGVPTAAGIPEWPPMTRESGPYFKIDKLIGIGDNYLDEYSVAVQDAKRGFNLVNEDFFESLVDITNVEKPDGTAGSDESDDVATSRGNIVIIAQKDKRIGQE